MSSGISEGISSTAPDCGLHQPWLQFLPGFTWLTRPSFFLGPINMAGTAPRPGMFRGRLIVA